uniref:kinetochore protein Spc25 isoform X2 n=1 Tax=Solea senegalensis TaxID=28829 RepID=UPI001CD83C1F|nr:kinetochore protein Spc25 isoform X2 [Solea senegalensis]
MMSITDPNTSVNFTGAVEEIHNKQLKTYEEIVDTTTELCQSHRQFVKSAVDTCLKKCKDDKVLFETIQTFNKDLQLKNASLREKRCDISKVISEIQQKEMQKDDIIQKIEQLKEEQAKRKDLIESQNKANKARLRNLQKARHVFQDHLGERMQFVFRNINPSYLDSVFVVTMGIKEDGSYEIVSSDPKLECLPVLESRLRETNHLPAFLANVRKEFIAQARS